MTRKGPNSRRYEISIYIASCCSFFSLKDEMSKINISPINGLQICNGRIERHQDFLDYEWLAKRGHFCCLAMDSECIFRSNFLTALQWTVSAVCIWSLGAGIMSLQGSQSRCRFWGGDTTFLWWTINCVLSSSIASCCPRWLICLFENGLFGWHAHLATIFFGKVWQATHCVVNNLLHCRKKIKLWQCTQFLKNCGIL